MINRIIKATWEFILLRLIAVFICVLVYILMSVQFQNILVTILGNSTFMYIMTGFISLILSFILVKYLFNLVILFINGCHIASLPYIDGILNKEYNSLIVGYYSFKAHIGSFGIVMGIRIVIDKLIDSSSEYINFLLKRCTFGEQLKSVSKFGLFRYIVKDIFYNSYDCIIYYLVKYTKPGTEDDCKGIYEAIIRYFLTLPKIMITSLSYYILIKIILKSLVYIITLYFVIVYGFLTSIKIYMILLIFYFIISSLVLKPLSSIVIVSEFDKSCNNELSRLENECSNFIPTSTIDIFKNNIKDFLKDRGIIIVDNEVDRDINNELDSDVDSEVDNDCVSAHVDEVNIESSVSSDSITEQDNLEPQENVLNNIGTIARRNRRTARNGLSSSILDNNSNTQSITQNAPSNLNSIDEEDITSSVAALISSIENQTDDLNIDFTDIDIFNDE